MARMNFTPDQRDSAFRANAEWLQKHKVDGVQVVLAAEPLRAAGQLYYCENCLFCSTARGHFDVDHLVADRSFRLWGRHGEARSPINMMILCKSTARNDFGCNQTKGARLYVPLVHAGEYLSMSGGASAFVTHERVGGAMEVGLYTAAGIVGIQVTHAPDPGARMTTLALSVRYF